MITLVAQSFGKKAYHNSQFPIPNSQLSIINYQLSIKTDEIMALINLTFQLEQQKLNAITL
jgi:hypothetical protein